MILRWLLAKWLAPRIHGTLNRKDLLTTSSASVGDFSGFAGATGTRRRQSVDSTRLASQIAVESGRALAQSKGLTNQIFTSVGPPFRALSRRRKRGDAEPMIQQGLIAKLQWKGRERLLNQKDLLITSLRVLDHLFGFCRATETRRRRSVDSTMLVSQVAMKRGRTLDQSKGLTNHAFSELGQPFSSFSGDRKQRDADLLIQQGLLAELR